MFVLSTDASYSWPVQVSIPVSGGKFEKHTFDAVFRRIPQSKIKGLLNADEATDFSFCKAILVDWKGIKDAKDEDIPFSESALDELLDFPQMAKMIVTTYLESLSGSKAKNS